MHVDVDHGAGPIDLLVPRLVLSLLFLCTRTHAVQVCGVEPHYSNRSMQVYACPMGMSRTPPPPLPPPRGHHWTNRGPEALGFILAETLVHTVITGDNAGGTLTQQPVLGFLVADPPPGRHFVL